MKFLECDLEEIIEKSNRVDLASRGLIIGGKLKRQLKIGGYGVADIVTVEKPYYSNGIKDHYKGVITVYELKKDRIGVSTFFQALNYIRGIQHYIGKHKENLEGCFNYKIVLIGRYFDDKGSFVFLPNIFTGYDIEGISVCEESKTCVELMKYSYEFNGVNFEELKDFTNKNHGL